MCWVILSYIDSLPEVQRILICGSLDSSSVTARLSPPKSPLLGNHSTMLTRRQQIGSVRVDVGGRLTVKEKRKKKGRIYGWLPLIHGWPGNQNPPEITSCRFFFSFEAVPQILWALNWWWDLKAGVRQCSPPGKSLFLVCFFFVAIATMIPTPTTIGLPKPKCVVEVRHQFCVIPLTGSRGRQKFCIAALRRFKGCCTHVKVWQYFKV